MDSTTTVVVKPEIEEYPILPSEDKNSWYYPKSYSTLQVNETNREPNNNSYEGDSSEELPSGTIGGNWGKKNQTAARFVRRGKIAAWGPNRYEYDVEERARKRLRLILPEFTGKPIEEDPILPHLRSPSPPIVGPYIPAPLHQPSYTSAIFDQNIGSSFRSGLVASLEQTSTELIQSEIALIRALGRFWAALTELDHRSAREKRHAPNPSTDGHSKIKGDTTTTANTTSQLNGVNSFTNSQRHPYYDREDTDMSGSATIKYLFTHPTSVKIDYTPPDMSAASHIIAIPPEHHYEVAARSLAQLRELQEDTQECIERLEEIRERLGKVRSLRDGVWAVMRSKAIEEMESELPDE